MPSSSSFSASYQRPTAMSFSASSRPGSQSSTISQGTKPSVKLSADQSPQRAHSPTHATLSRPSLRTCLLRQNVPSTLIHVISHLPARAGAGCGERRRTAPCLRSLCGWGLAARWPGAASPGPTGTSEGRGSVVDLAAAPGVLRLVVLHGRGGGAADLRHRGGGVAQARADIVDLDLVAGA